MNELQAAVVHPPVLLVAICLAVHAPLGHVVAAVAVKIERRRVFVSPRSPGAVVVDAVAHSAARTRVPRRAARRVARVRTRTGRVPVVIRVLLREARGAPARARTRTRTGPPYY